MFTLRAPTLVILLAVLLLAGCPAAAAAWSPGANVDGVVVVVLPVPGPGEVPPPGNGTAARVRLVATVTANASLAADADPPAVPLTVDGAAAVTVRVASAGTGGSAGSGTMLFGTVPEKRVAVAGVPATARFLHAIDTTTGAAVGAPLPIGGAFLSTTSGSDAVTGISWHYFSSGIPRDTFEMHVEWNVSDPYVIIELAQARSTGDPATGGTKERAFSGRLTHADAMDFGAPFMPPDIVPFTAMLARIVQVRITGNCGAFDGHSIFNMTMRIPANHGAPAGIISPNLDYYDCADFDTRTAAEPSVDRETVVNSMLRFGSAVLDDRAPWPSKSNALAIGLGVGLSVAALSIGAVVFLVWKRRKGNLGSPRI
jgi:hypothetical protein